ncbi:class I SAM-dependent methyltransferase [Mucilaginibacter pedocola]|uniref:Methyltransferase domain-containing protein n=1 Tax=Mucilaginibacter pedocola TaxID=1792845 RepID=A0A1S9P8K1_9SPHI|nr:methyltransferase domain-containing protein [Mucilaginibacter pedocola]OOQ57272.1 hypothetical protein BC343_14240 [Mucilaginibacter pedocola]
MGTPAVRPALLPGAFFDDEVLDMLQPLNNIPAEAPTPDFEALYLELRRREQRIYTDLQLARLPALPRGHIHRAEWRIRRQSAKRLVRYLAAKKRTLNILEIGCGNGWLAAKLADIPKANVCAIDVNRTEVHQAKRVFNKPNLQFFSGSLNRGRFGATQFDVVLFAAAIQYFSPLSEVLHGLLPWLAPKGEVHLVDSNFYDHFTVADAAKRTQEYYTGMGYPELADFYFHHRLDELEGFNYKVMHKPAGPVARLLKGSPFYWIKVMNNTETTSV